MSKVDIQKHTFTQRETQTWPPGSDAVRIDWWSLLPRSTLVRRFSTLSSALSCPQGLMGNEPWNIPVMETEDAIRLWGGVTMVTHGGIQTCEVIYLFFSHTRRATDDCSTNLSQRPRPLLFLLHNYLRSLSFLLPSVLLHLSPSSLLSSHNLWAAPLSPSLILHIPACLPPGWLWNRPGREGGRGVLINLGQHRGTVVDSDPRTGATAPREDFLQRVAVPHNSCREEEWVCLRERVNHVCTYRAFFLGHLLS